MTRIEPMAFLLFHVRLDKSGTPDKVILFRSAAEYTTFGLTPPQIGVPSVKVGAATSSTVISASRASSSLTIVGIEWYGALLASGTTSLQLQVSGGHEASRRLGTIIRDSFTIQVSICSNGF